MTVNKELKKLEDQIDELEDGEIKRQLSISYRNIMHNNGQLPCDGIWNFQTGECEEFDETSIPPKVSAGRNRVIDIGESLTLSGEIKDFKNPITYKGWKQASPPSTPLVQLEGSADGSTIIIKPATEGEYTFTFEALDIKGQSGSDSVVVTVKSAETRKEEREAKKAEEEKKESELKKEEKPLIKEPEKENKKPEIKEDKLFKKPEPEIKEFKKPEFRGR